MEYQTKESDFGYRLVEPCTEVDVDSREVIIMSICLEKVAEKYTDRDQGVETVAYGCRLPKFLLTSLLFLETCLSGYRAKRALLSQSSLRLLRWLDG